MIGLMAAIDSYKIFKIGKKMRSLTFASQVNRPRVDNLIPLGDIKTIKLVDGWIAVGGHEFQHRIKLRQVAAGCPAEFAVFVAKPIVSQIGESRAMTNGMPPF